jgi:hypothetical protein
MNEMLLAEYRTNVIRLIFFSRIKIAYAFVHLQFLQNVVSALMSFMVSYHVVSISDAFGIL